MDVDPHSVIAGGGGLARSPYYTKGDTMLKAEIFLEIGSFNEAHHMSVPYEKGNETLVKLIEEMAGAGCELVDARVNLRCADGAKISIAFDDGEWKE